MWKQLSTWFYSISSGWVTLIAVLVFILFTALVLPGQSSTASTSEEVGSPDLSFYYSTNDLYRMAEGYGEVGRADYVQARFTFDLIWPLVYTFFLVTSISWIYQRLLPAGSPGRMINLLPFLGMIGDYLENISTSIVMGRYPLATPVIDWMAGIFTTLKWLLIGGSFIGLLLGGVLLVWQIFPRDGGDN
jgi:hypothetical protein